MTDFQIKTAAPRFDVTGAVGGIVASGVLQSLDVGIGTGPTGMAGLSFTGPTGPAGTSTGGTYTPIVTFGGSTAGITYAAQRGKYSKLNNVVFIEIEISLNSKGSAPGVFTVSLPTVVDSFVFASLACSWSNLALDSGYTSLGGFTTSGGQTMVIQQSGPATVINISLSDTNFANNSQIRLYGCYFSQ